MKKMIALLLFLTVAINTAGCGNFSEKENNYEEQVIVDEWVDNGGINRIFSYTDILYFTTYAEIIGTSEGEHYCDNRLYSVDRNGNDVKEIPIDLSNEEPLSMITSVMVNEDTISIWLSANDPDGAEPVNVLIQADYDGKEKTRTDLNTLVNGENVDRALQTEQGQIAAMAEDNIYIFDGTLQLTEQIGLEGRAIGMTVSKDGKLVCASEDSNYKQKLHIINVEKGNIEETIPLKRHVAMDDNSMFAGGQYDICYRNETGIYGYDLADKKAACLLNFAKSYLLDEELQRGCLRIYQPI